MNLRDHRTKTTFPKTTWYRDQTFIEDNRDLFTSCKVAYGNNSVGSKQVRDHKHASNTLENGSVSGYRVENASISKIGNSLVICTT